MLWARGSLWGYRGTTGEGRVHQNLATRPPRGKGLLGRSVLLPSWAGDGRSWQILGMIKDRSTLAGRGLPG